MVITSSTSQTKRGKTGRDQSSKKSSKKSSGKSCLKNTKGSIKKSGMEREAKPKEQASNNKKPLNHNALIATSANDTLDNIRVSLDMIREIVCSDNDGMALSDDTKQGLFLHIENLIKALSFLRTL